MTITRSKKPHIYLWLEENCICFDLKAKGRRHVFGLELTETYMSGKQLTRHHEGTSWLRNPFRSHPLPKTLREFIDTCEPAYAKVKIKPDMEARYASIIAKLKPVPY